MRILHFVESLRVEGGGVVSFVLDLAEMLAAAGEQVTIATFDPPPELLATIDRRNFGLKMLPKPRVGGVLWSRRQLSELAGSLEETDVLHLHCLWRPTTRQLGRVARAEDLPWFLSLHGMLSAWPMAQKSLKKRLYLRLFGSGLLRAPRALHATSGGEERQARRWLPAGSAPVMVLPCAIDAGVRGPLPGPELAREELGLTGDDGPLLLFLGRLHPKKRPELLVDAVEFLQGRGPAPLLVFAGPGEAEQRRSLLRRARDVGLESRIRLVGPVHGQLKYSLLQLASVLALPTHQENFGLVLVEALACGTPVVTTRGVDIWKELQDGGGAVIAEPSARALADVLEPLLRDHELRDRMGAMGRDHVLGWLDPEELARRYLEMYRAGGQG